jgi:TrmH family RNA methyltransferase
VTRVVRSRDNPLFKSLLKLESSSRERRRASMTLLEGEHLVESYAAASLGEAEVVAAGETALKDAALGRLFDRVPARSRVVLDDRLLPSISPLAAATGLVAVIATPHPGPRPEAVRDAVLLERIQDPGNLGSILRTACAAGVLDVFLSEGTVAAWSPKVVRAGMGAHFGLRIHEGVDLAEVSTTAAGRVYAAVVRAPLPLFQADLSGPVAWLFGNEGSGLSKQSTIRAERIGIPMPGGTESLNVAAAAAVCLFEQVRQRAVNTPGARA